MSENIKNEANGNIKISDEVIITISSVLQQHAPEDRATIYPLE